MEKIQVVFSYAPGIFSKVVRVGTWSQWSHCGIVTPEGTVVEATFRERGVKEKTLAEFATHATSYHVVEMACHDAQAIIDAMRSQIDKPYDWTGLFGIAFHDRDWQEQDSWFCSELVAWAFEQGGTPLFTNEFLFRITPQQLYILYHESVQFV